MIVVAYKQGLVGANRFGIPLITDTELGRRHRRITTSLEEDTSHVRLPIAAVLGRILPLQLPS